MLQLENVQAGYGKIPALRGISLSIEQKKLVALIGANGAGKSTTLRCILGLVPLTSGSIWFMGNRIDGLPPSTIVRMGISLCPEGRKLWPEMTVKENLELGAYVREEKEASKGYLEKIFAYFPILKERQGQMAGSLSGGEQQMVALGRAMMSRPKLLMLDEPSLGLSPIYVEKMNEIILNIHQSGTTVLLVEQNAFLALSISSRCYVLEVGGIATEGDSQDLMQNEYVKRAYLGRKKSA